jgi:hypothetical protein
LKHRASKRFWKLFSDLPQHLLQQARKQYTLLQQNPQHPSLRFKPVGGAVWSARVNDNYRAVAIKREYHYLWIWIGSHDDYDKLVFLLG